ncbi:hypothetical protein, partial [Methanosarcina sp. 2.H.T.1A.3]|uniref:hypothetical protein n=1 Tax=Methanosarcina sp. 2.H.T.1A.3 TaxID=1483597 RepID=UPI00064F533D
VHIIVESESGLQYIRNSVIEIGDVQLQDVDLFPESYSLLLKSIIVYFLIMAGALASSSYRTDMAAAWIAVSYGFATWQEWCYGNLVTVSLIGLMAIIVIARFQKKNSRSVY